MAHSLTEESFDGTGGLRIFLRSWRPEGRPRGVLVVCHGLNAHGGHYAWAARQWADGGLATYAVDLRGRGRSEGERFFVEDIAQYVADVAGAVKIASTREPGLPVFLLGHSAGGVVGCHYVLDHPDELAGFICESFAFEVPTPSFVLAAVEPLSRFAPRLPLLRLRNRDFSRDPAIVAALDSDPLTAREVQPARTIAALVRANQRLRAELAQIGLPLLILHGTADRVTLPRGSQAFHAMAGSPDKTLRLYPGHVHDLLNDTGRQDVAAFVADWIHERVAGAAQWKQAA